MRKGMEAHFLMVLCLACIILFGATTAQNIFPPSRKRTFYMNKASDCDGKPRSTGANTVEIYGKTSEIQQSGRVLSCTITIDTEDQREPRRFKLQFLAVTIRDPNVHFHIYDGEYNGRQLHVFDKNNQLPPDLDFDFTSGQRVSFRLVRGEFDTNFDIRIIAIPISLNVRSEFYIRDYEQNSVTGQDGPIAVEQHFSVGTIVGLSVGGVALFMASIATIALIIKCRQSKRNTGTGDTYAQNDKTNVRAVGQTFYEGHF